MKFKILFTALFLATFSCTDNNKNIDKDLHPVEINKKSTEPIYQVIAVEISASGWGYQILKDGKLIINQEQIPAIQGIQFFKSEEDAIKTGELALKKIKGQVFPPTISIQELDSLGVLK